MATDVKRSALNPFRTPIVSPNPTGAGPSTGTSSSVQSPGMLQPQPQSHSTTLAIPTQSETNLSNGARSPSEDLLAELEATTLEDNAPSEPPPAYTPAANPYEGEATVEYGPRRPFQPAPPAPPLPQQFTGSSRAGYSVTPQVTGLPIAANPTGEWSQYPGRGARGHGPSGLGPPPQHPSTRRRGPGPEPRVSSASTPASGPGRQLSDFARDFYASTPGSGQGGRDPSPTQSDLSSNEAPEPEHFERVRPTVTTSPSHNPPPGPPPTRHAPPPGPPPSRNVPPSGPPPASPLAPIAPPPSRPSRGVSNSVDEGKPTSSPTPGRPLLNNGKILVYPAGHECRKCLNTGYKNFDPSHPCRKCWERYGKPYSGAIMYAPRTQQSQRPLPSFRPPQLRHQHSRSQPSLLPPSTPSVLSRSSSASRPGLSPNPVSSGYPGRAVSNPASPQPVQTPYPQLGFMQGRPPPGSTVVLPGDARIGGRLCWRCDGDGTVSFLIFDVERCPVCNGLGRTFQ
ncbi:hypothetical protein M0805_001944 [Coniferiporia weirii]|nr:hypothetical protein M0805_001944 [Coniferiporia weirii]